MFVIEIDAAIRKKGAQRRDRRCVRTVPNASGCRRATPSPSWIVASSLPPRAWARIVARPRQFMRLR